LHPIRTDVDDPQDLAASCLDPALRVAETLRREAPALDRAGLVPPETIRRLGEAGLLAAALRPEQGGLGLGASTGVLLEILTVIGAGNLAIGRLYEGHVNVLLLIDRFGSLAQRQRVMSAVKHHHALLGVWNTDGRRPLSLERAGGSWRLSGTKSFASGAGLVAQALVTAPHPDGGRQMILVPMEPLADRIDRSGWQPLGMRASMSFEVDFDGAALESDALIGRPDDYLAEPWFSAGCIRFAAVQLGGAVELLRAVHAHLRRTRRADDPYQVERFARMRLAVETGRLWLARAADAFDAAAPDAIIVANMARSQITEVCTLVLDLAGRSIGVQGMLQPHPLERLSRDLMTYLRQPAPDAALASIGRDALAAEQLPW
jgi:alkylation response protein AidB-like acyl-CoA dehydrogenase